MFQSDKPIDNNKNDKLHRKTFSSQIAHAILSYNSSENFTISLCGPWGSGKTSILNMIKEEINRLSNDYPIDKKPIIINFNPWNYSSREQLLSQFFLTINDELHYNHNDSLNKIGSAIEKYYNIIEFASFIPGAGKYLGPLSKIFNGLGKQISEISNQKESITRQKSEVTKLLNEQEHKFIIVIDDIDRLSNSEICLIFQLVNSIADFPNMIYLLSFDKEIVTRALHEIQKCNGFEYLEKIIQVPFDIPIAKKSEIENVFFEKLGKIINESVENEEYWSDVFRNCISPYICNIRDVVRLLNVFKFKYDLLHKELYWVDLLALTVIQIFEPKVYNWIYENQTILTGSAHNNNYIVLNSNSNENEKYKEIKNTIEKLSTTNVDKTIESMQILFPNFAEQTGAYHYDHSSNDELRGNHRIASSDKFPLYFHMSLSDIRISNDEIMNSINNLSPEELNLYFNELSEKELLKDYLYELCGKIQFITHNKITIFLEELFKVQGYEKNKRVSSEFETSISNDALHCIKMLYIHIDKKDRIKYLIDLIENCNYTAFLTIFEFIYNLEKYSGEFNGDIISELKLTDEDMSKIEHLLILKLQKLPNDINILDTDSYYAFDSLWKKIDANAYNNYILEKLRYDENIPKFLDIYRGIWHSEEDIGISFKNNSYTNYISKEEIYNHIINLRKTKQFKTLKHQYKQNAIAFYQWYNLGTEDYHKETNINLIDSIIKDWEND